MPLGTIFPRRAMIAREATSVVVASFDPLTLSPVLWLDANDASTLFQDDGYTTPATANNDPVGGWKDKSGNLNHVSQSVGGQRPLLKTSVLNSKNIVQWDGVDDIMAAASAASLDLTTGVDLVIVLNILGDSGSNHADTNAAMIIKEASSSSGQAVYGMGNLSPAAAGHSQPYLGLKLSSPSFGWATAQSVSSDPPVPLYNTWHLQDFGYDSTAGAGLNLVVWFDGAQYSVGGTLTGTINITTGHLSIGGYNGSFSSDSFMNGKIAELFVFSNKLSNTDRTNLSAYLNSKWSIY